MKGGGERKEVTTDTKKQSTDLRSDNGHVRTWGKVTEELGSTLITTQTNLLL